MNDRLKIRVWDKVYENYWKEEEVYLNIQWLLYPDNDNINNLIIEQCTGIKDKNGKLIYEGDIVRYDVDSERIGRIASVKFNEAHFFLERNERDVFELWKPLSVEVVGNVHEEMLKNDIKEIFEEAKSMSKDLSKDGNKCIKCGARADRITINYDYICPDCRASNGLKNFFRGKK